MDHHNLIVLLAAVVVLQIIALGRSFMTASTPPGLAALTAAVTAATNAMNAAAALIQSLANQEGDSDAAVGALAPGLLEAASSLQAAVTAASPPPAAPLTVGPAVADTPVVGSAYSLTLEATGGVAPVSVTVDGLPDGLAFDATTLMITGTPTAGGAYVVSVTAHDSSEPTAESATQTYDWTF